MELGIIIGTITIIVVMASLHSKAVRFKCNKCDESFKIKMLVDIISPHFFYITYTKCPRCNRISWCKEIKELRNK